MADRSVIVRLRAEVGQFVAGTQRAKASMSEFGREVSGRGKTSRADIEQIGRTALVAGAVMAAGFGKMLLTAADFEKQMSGVKAVSGATAEEMGRLSDAAIAAGADVKLAGVTASDAARAEAELVKAGISVSDVLGGALMGSLSLASAGQLDFAKSAEIAAQAMNIFDLRGSQVGHVADVLAAAANKSAADVGQLGDALRQGGLVASQTGLSLEETVAALSAFADNALLGSDAGTSLKTMLQRLTPQSKEAQQRMDELGFSAYDAQGNFVGLEGLAQELQDALGNMTVEQRNATMALLFGTDAVRGANVLYEQGAAGVREYVEAVDDQGAAARMAAIQNDNLRGDIEALGGAIESALIENGSKATGMLRSITQGATGAVEGFSSLPSAAQSTALGLGAVAAGGTLVLGVVGTMYPKLVQANEALKKMGASGQFLSRNLGRIVGGLGAIGAGLAVFTTFQAVMGGAAASGKEWAESMTPSAMDFETYDELIAKISGVTAAQRLLSDEADSSSAPWDADYRAELRAGADALDPVAAQLVRIRALSATLARQLGITKSEAVSFVRDQQAAGVDILADNYDGLKASLAGTFYEMSAGSTGARQLGDALVTLDSDIASVEDKAKALSEAIAGIFAPLDTQAALDQFNSGLLDMAENFGDADEAVGDARDRIADARDRLDELLSLPAEERGEAWSGQVESARDAIVEAEADIQEAVEGTSRTLEGNSRSAIDNRDMLDQLARVGAAAIERASADQTMSMEDVMAIRTMMIAQMETEATRLGLNKEDVQRYTDKLREIPLGEIRTTVVVDSKEAEASLDRLLAKLFGLVSIGLGMSADVAQLEKFIARGQRAGAAGGLVPDGLTPLYRAVGGPSGSDTVPAWLTPGEFVMRKSSVDRFGLGLMEALNTGIMPPSPSVLSAGTSGGMASRNLYGGIHLHYPRPEAEEGVPRVMRKLGVTLAN